VDQGMAEWVLGVGEEGKDLSADPLPAHVAMGLAFQQQTSCLLLEQSCRRLQMMVPEQVGDRLRFPAVCRAGCDGLHPMEGVSTHGRSDGGM